MICILNLESKGRKMGGVVAVLNCHICQPQFLSMRNLVRAAWLATGMGPDLVPAVGPVLASERVPQWKPEKDLCAAFLGVHHTTYSICCPVAITPIQPLSINARKTKPLAQGCGRSGSASLPASGGGIN